MRALTYLFTSAIILVSISSCSTRSDGIELIPEEAQLVVAFNVKTLAEKANYEEWDELEFVQAAKEEVDQESGELKDLFEEFMEDPTSLGLDLRKDAHFFIMAEGRRGGIGGVTVDMLDRDDFTEFLEKFIDETGVDYLDDDIDDYSLIQVENDFIVLFDDDRAGFFRPMGYMNEDELYQQVEYLATLDDNDRLTQDESFNNFVANTSDVSAWLNGEIMEQMMGMADRELRELKRQTDTDLGDYTYESHLTFMDDEVELVTTYDNEEAEAMMAKYDLFDNKIDDQLLDYLPGESAMCGGIAINIQGMLEMLDKEDQYKDIYREYKKMDEVQEIVEGLSGDLAFNLFGFEEQEVAYTDYDYSTGNYRPVTKTRMENVPQAALVIGAKDANALMDALEDNMPGLQRKGDLQLLMEGGMQIYIAENEDGIMFTNDEDLAQGFQDEEEADDSLADENVGDKLQDGPYYFNVEMDLDNLPTEMREDMRDDEAQMASLVDDLIDHAEFYMVDDNASKLSVLVHDGDGNSLWRIIQLADEMYQDSRAY